jgi:osmotically-inducible protein OsmY
MTDKQLHDEILAELDYEPEVHPERIGVSVENGVVTLSGHVDSYRQKLAAERVVKRVYSAKAVVDELEVRLPSRDEVPDQDLARAAVRTLETMGVAPPDSVRITVREGHLLLDGEVDWHYQRQATEMALRHLRGVRGVKNHLRVRETASPEDVRERIDASLRRLAEVEADGISVETVGGMAILRGQVRSLREREDVEQAAWRAPGVSEVENRLIIAF